MNKLTGKGLIATVAVLAMALPMTAIAGVDVNISIPFFGFFAYEPQPVVVAPSPYGYAPNGSVAQPAPAGAVFSGGYWYLPSGGNWYVAAQSGGPWAMIGRERVPYAVISGPVLMERPQAYYGVPEGPSVGISINPWIMIGGNGGHSGGRGHGHGHDD